jgi:hypothetical protein
MVMEIKSIEDFDKAKSCLKCGKLFNISEGNMILPEASGFASGVARDIEVASGDTSKFRFMCFKCQSRIRNRKRLLWGTLFFLFGLILLLEQLGIVD